MNMNELIQELNECIEHCDAQFIEGEEFEDMHSAHRNRAE